MYAAIAKLKAAGLENWSVDLIGGLPGQVRTGVTHVCACVYRPWTTDPVGLVADPSTPFYRHRQTMAQWEASVDEAIASGAAHVSVYDLQVRKRAVRATSVAMT